MKVRVVIFSFSGLLLFGVSLILFDAHLGRKKAVLRGSRRVEGILLDTNKTVGDIPGFNAKDTGWNVDTSICNVRDTLWYVNVYYDESGKAVDTLFYGPTRLAEIGSNAQHFFGTEEQLMAYAERKRIRTFCYKDSAGILYFIHLKKDETYQIASATSGMMPTIASKHREGWSKICGDEGFWMGNMLIISGQRMAMCNDANSILKSQYAD